MAIMGARLDEANAETRRKASILKHQGIQSDTQQLENMGLAGNAYGAYQSGAQEKRVKTREGVFDLTQRILKTDENARLAAYGQQLLAQKKRYSTPKTTNTHEVTMSAAKADFKNKQLEKAFAPVTTAGKATEPKVSAWDTAYNIMRNTVGMGPTGVLNAMTQTQQQRQNTQRDIYTAVKKKSGIGAADTLFGANPILNSENYYKVQTQNSRAAEIVQKQNERYAPIERTDAESQLKTIDARLDELDGQIAQANAQIQYARSREVYQESANKLNALKSEKESLTDDRKWIDRRMKATIYSDYMKNLENIDFTQKAVVREDEQDEFYRGINDLSSGHLLGGTQQSQRVSLMPTAQKGYDGGREAAQYMTDEEKEVYNYIYATQGAEKAEAYVEDLRTLINARYAEGETQRFSKMADEQPILASAMSIFGTIAKTAGAIYSYVAEKDIDPNSPYYAGSRLNQVIRSEVANNISDGVGRLDRYSTSQLKKMGYTNDEIDRMQNGELRAGGSDAVGAALGFLYQTGMSIADFLLLAETGSAASLTIMGAGSAADTVINAKQRGASDGDALALGTVAGIAEVFFEKFSLDKYYHMSTAGKNAVLKNMFAQMGIEASEEFFTECTNILADMAIMGDNGNTRLKINAYKAAGLSQKQAEIEAHMDNVEQVMLAALGGAISGGVIGGGKTTIMLASGEETSVRPVSTVKNGVLDLTNPDTQVELSEENIKEQARKHQKATEDAVKRVQTLRLEDLKATDANPVKGTLVDVAAAELKGKGESDATVKEVKSVLDKTLKGETITPAERLVIVGNPVIREAFNITEPMPKYKMNETGEMKKTQTVQPASGTFESLRGIADESTWEAEAKKLGYNASDWVSTSQVDKNVYQVDNKATASVMKLVRKSESDTSGYIVPSSNDAKISDRAEWTKFYDLPENPSGELTIVKPAVMSFTKADAPFLELTSRGVMEKQNTTANPNESVEAVSAQTVQTYAETQKTIDNINKKLGTDIRFSHEEMPFVDSTVKLARSLSDPIMKDIRKIFSYAKNPTGVERAHEAITEVALRLVSGEEGYINGENLIDEIAKAVGNIEFDASPVVQGMGGYDGAQIQEIRDYIRKTPMRMGVYGAAGFDYMVSEDIRKDKTLFGTLKLTKKSSATSSDSIYQELSDQYPDLFDPGIINTDDQIMRMAEFVKSTYNGGTIKLGSAEYGEYAYEAAQQIGNNLVNGLIEQYTNIATLREEGKNNDNAGTIEENTAGNQNDGKLDSDTGKRSQRSETKVKQIGEDFTNDALKIISAEGKDETAAKSFIKKAMPDLLNEINDSKKVNDLFAEMVKYAPMDIDVARARIAYDDAVFKAKMELGLVNRYEVGKHVRERQKAERAATANDMTQVKKAFEDRKPLKRKLQQIKDDNLFTAADESDIEYALRGGEVDLQGRTNAAAFKQRLDAERELRAVEQVITDYNKQRKKGLFDQALNMIAGSHAWKDKAAGLLYSTETMERNIEDIVKDEAQAELLIKTFFSPVHANEADATRFKEDYRARVEALKLNSEEKKAVQLRGEGSADAMIKAQLGEVAFKRINMGKVTAAVEVFRSIYDDMITAANDALIRNGYDPIEYRKNYFPHFNDPEADTVMKKVAEALGVRIATEELPTDIAGLTAAFRPGKTYFGHIFERKGETSTIDAVKGFETYISGVADIIYHTDDIQRLRALESALRYEHSNEGIRKRMMTVMDATSNDPDRQQAEFDALFNEKQGHLGKFVTELREYTNLLANKKSLHDRSAEADLGRKMYNIVNTLNSRVAANMVGGNIGVALTNFIPLTQAWGTTDTKYMLMGMTQTIASIFNDDGFSARSDFLTNRKGSERLDSKVVEKISKAAAIPFTLVDDFASETIVRAQYMQNLAKGMTSEEAMDAANDWAARIMADRSKGALPTYFKRSNPLSKMMGMFQVEVNNQLRHAFKDIPRALKDRGLAAIAMALFKLCLGAWIYNEFTEPLTGRRAALDPANIMMEFAMDLTKKDLGTATFLQFVWDKAVKGEPWKLEDKDVSTATALENLWGNLMDQTPFVGALLGGEGGRVPLSSTLPDMWGIGTDVISAMQGDTSWKRAGETAGKELLKPVLYLVPPFGGGQAKKSFEGLKTVIQGGSFKLDKEGDKQLQFATEQGLKDYLQAAVFGKWSLPQAQDYVKKGFDMLTAQETTGWKAAQAVGVDDVDYMRLRARFKTVEPTKNADEKTIETAKQKKREMLMSWPDLTPEQKQLIDKYLIAGKDAAPTDYTTEALMKLSSEPGDAYANALGLQNNGISPEKYLEFYELKKEYQAAADDLLRNETAKNYFSEMGGEKYETLTPEKINDRLHDAIWNDADLTENQRYLLESKLTGSNVWTDKSVTAARAGIRTEKFYEFATHYRDYAGNEPSWYAWMILRKDRSMTAEQQLITQDLLAGTSNQKKIDELLKLGLPKEPTTRLLAGYKDIKESDANNQMDYSDTLTVKLKIADERGFNVDQKMKLTDSLLGTTLEKDAKIAEKNANISIRTYYEFYSKFWTLNAKNENGKTVSGLKKRRAKEYLETLGLSMDQMQYLLFSTGDYTKW